MLARTEARLNEGDKESRSINRKDWLLLLPGILLSLITDFATPDSAAPFHDSTALPGALVRVTRGP